ncbi:MAG TPA: DUF664 domain-containing protein [Candidatus Saccharimonadales bacterium]
MQAQDILIEAYGRIQAQVAAAVKDLSEQQLAHRPNGKANSIAWLIWHTARVQDAQIASVAGHAEVWRSGGWQQKFGLPLEAADTGYGHSNEQVAAVRASAELLTDYYDATWAATKIYLASLNPDALDSIVDKRWDPPVTLGVRLVSILSDCLQHVGQANYLRGIVLQQK